jgi:peptidoglycan/xylan/chitin deacetylase (PgdA/CDA1 family)
VKSLLRLARHANEVFEVPRDLILRRYPPFVTGGPLPRGHVPVFVFHSAQGADFERKLHYLAENRYVTLSAAEYLEILTGARPAPERAVVLTFDDGRASVFTVAYPLLRKFGMKAVLFIVPGRLDSAAPRRTPEGAAAGAEGFVSWEEVVELSRSRIFDIESHSLMHARVHTEPRLSGFLAPADREGYKAMDVPLIRQPNGSDLLAGEAPLGTPLLHSAPRTAEVLRFYEDPSIRKACVEAVADAGGEAFFEKPGWERQLERLAARIPVTGRLESPLEREQAVRRELAESKRQIEDRTGRPVTHLCYPWHASGPTARRLAAELGYRTAFCGKVPGTPLTAVGGDPLAIARIGEDYVELLPGRGREDLLGVLRHKWRRRINTQGKS